MGRLNYLQMKVKDAAAGILNQKYLTNVELALNEVQNADNLRAEAQKALESNDVLEFKSRVGITLTADEQQEYTDNINTFVESKISELESRTFAGSYSRSNIPRRYRRRSDISPEHQGMGQSGQFGIIRFI